MEEAATRDDDSDVKKRPQDDDSDVKKSSLVMALPDPFTVHAEYVYGDYLLDDLCK